MHPFQVDTWSVKRKMLQNRGVIFIIFHEGKKAREITAFLEMLKYQSTSTIYRWGGWEKINEL